MKEEDKLKLKNQNKKAVQETKDQVRDWVLLPDGRTSLVSSVGGNNNYSPKCRLVPMETETVLPVAPKTDAMIVFGNDRPASRFGEFTSDTDASSIDIVVGRHSGKIDPKGDTEPGVDPSFDHDAARIHISQKSNPDKNFKIKDAGQGVAKARSSVCAKADCIRLIGRESVKIVTGTDKKNSQGGDIKSIQGISIVAGNIESEVQPMVKGESLTQSLKELKELTADLNAIMKQMLQAQMEFNGALMNHFHYSTVFGNANTPSDSAVSAGGKVQIEHLQQTMRSLQVHRQNLINWEQNNLCASGKNYVLSRWNKIN